MHLAVADLDARFQNKIDNLIAHPLDRLDAVVQKISLALALELALDRVANKSLVVTGDDCFDRQTVERRRFNGRHVFRADEREVKRARNRRRRKREHIDELEELLE